MVAQRAQVVRLPVVTRQQSDVTPRAKTLRAEWRARAAQVVGLAARSESVKAVAQQLGVTHVRVQQWASPRHEAAIALGDVMASPTAVARTALLAALALVDEHAPVKPVPARIGVERRALRAMSAYGRLVEYVEKALVDGVIGADEAKEIIRAARETSARIDALVQEVAIMATGEPQ
jgi:hypothetical protein